MISELDEISSGLDELALDGPAARLPVDILMLIFDHLEEVHSSIVASEPFAMQRKVDMVRRQAAVNRHWRQAWSDRHHGRTCTRSLRALQGVAGPLSHLLIAIAPSRDLRLSNYSAAIAGLSDRVTLLPASDELGGPQLSLRSTLAVLHKLIEHLDPGCCFSRHSITHLHLGIDIVSGSRLLPFHDMFPMPTAAVAAIVRSCVNLDGLVLDGSFRGPMVPEADDQATPDRRPLRHLRLMHSRLDVLEWILSISRAELRTLAIVDNSRWPASESLWSTDLPDRDWLRLRPYLRSARALSLRIPSHHESYGYYAVRILVLMPDVDELHVRFDFSSQSVLRNLVTSKVQRLSIVEEIAAAALQIHSVIQLLDSPANASHVRALELVGSFGHKTELSKLREICRRRDVELTVRPS